MTLYTHARHWAAPSSVTRRSAPLAGALFAAVAALAPSGAAATADGELLPVGNPRCADVAPFGTT